MIKAYQIREKKSREFFLQPNGGYARLTVYKVIKNEKTNVYRVG